MVVEKNVAVPDETMTKLSCARDGGVPPNSTSVAFLERVLMWRQVWDFECRDSRQRTRNEMQPKSPPYPKALDH